MTGGSGFPVVLLLLPLHIPTRTQIALHRRGLSPKAAQQGSRSNMRQIQFAGPLAQGVLDLPFGSGVKCNP